MHVNSRSREILTAMGATLSVVLITAILSLVHTQETAAGMVFLTIVVWCSTRASLRVSLSMAVLCAVLFDYFFLQPLHTFRLAGVHQWVEMFSFLASSIVVGRLSELARRQAQQVEQRNRDLERLYTLSQEMMLHQDAIQLVHDLPRLLQTTFALETVVLYVRDTDQFYSTMDEVPASVQASMRTLTQPHGAPISGLIDLQYLALMLGMTPIGALAWKSDLLSRETATAVSAQVAIAMTRASAIERFTRMEAMREGERLRTALIDSLTHELRTPLTSIRAAATTLVQGEGLDEDLRHELAAVVDEESACLDKLIGDAVEMAEVDAKVVRVHVSSRHVRTLLEEAVEELRAILAAHRVLIEVSEPDTPVWFDAQLLGRVLRHLLENAARYSPRGSRITLRSWRDQGRLEFSVEDNGPGIETIDLPLIFEKFYRGKRGTASGKGTGMGLPIARAILEAHGGGIEVSSTPGEGATFRFWVPLVERDPGAAR